MAESIGFLHSGIRTLALGESDSWSQSKRLSILRNVRGHSLGIGGFLGGLWHSVIQERYVSLAVPDFRDSYSITHSKYFDRSFEDRLDCCSSSPLYREGFSFSIPGTTVEVAKECSGIHSAIALIITTLLGGHLFLRSGWSRGILTLAVFPVTILKNGMRIATLTLLAAYVDPRFVKGAWLHKSGGIPFFAVGILLMVPVLWALVKAEKRKASEKPVISESVISDQETKSKRRLESQ